jgi:nitrogen fixation/metabolism regulation signal transduction histidine kinase
MMAEIRLVNKLAQLINKLNPFRGYANEQAGLVLIASVPCFLMALVCLRLAGASYYLVSFFAIVFGLLIIYAAITGKNRANFQIQTLSNLVEAMIDGDYTLRGRAQSNPAFQDLLNLINQLSDNLHKHKLKAEESQLLLEKIMQQMDALVIAVDSNGQVAMINEAARNKLNFHANLSDKHNLESLGLEQLLAYTESGVVRFNQKVMAGEYFLFKDQFYSNNKQHQLYLLTRADKMLREKEREAWQNLLRVLSHELNNSLTPIATFSSTMLRKINKENQVTDVNKFRDGLVVIKERAESLNQFITSYSQLSHLPKANKQNYVWRDKLVQLTRLFSDCQFQHDLLDNHQIDFSIQADPQQLEQVFINLFKNAREAMSSNPNKLIEIEVEVDEVNLILKIRDNGVGIANPSNLFVPFYTTKQSGSGIGLTLCQQIINNHDGTISLANRSDKPGAEVVISLPLNS